MPESGGSVLIEAYRRAYLIRRVETEISERYHPDPSDPGKSPMRTPVHLSVGQETVAVGVALAVEQQELTMYGDDYQGAYWPNGLPHVWFGHRSHAPYLAFGGDLERMIAELYGRATGCSGGRAGSMHLHDEAHGLMGGTPIVGSAVSLATGSAWAAKLEGSHRLTVVFCGDAVPETGQFWESLNFASLHNLRLLYVIEDNGLSTATPQDVRRGKLWQQFCYAVGEGMDAITVEHELDDFASVYGGALGALQSLARQRPAILEVDTTRACAHVGPEIDHDQLLNRDHLLTLRRAAGEKADGISRVVDAQVDAAFRAAEDAPWPA